MSIDKLIERLREFAKATCGTVTAANGEQLTYEDSVIWLAADSLASTQEQAKHYPTVAGENMRLREEVASTQAEILRLTRERDNLWMALLHAKMCFHGGVKSSNPDQRAHDDVDRALAGNGPKNGAALASAKRVGRIAASSLSQDGEEGL
jgi:hypothetical protein